MHTMPGEIETLDTRVIPACHDLSVRLLVESGDGCARVTSADSRVDGLVIECIEVDGVRYLETCVATAWIAQLLSALHYPPEWLSYRLGV